VLTLYEDTGDGYAYERGERAIIPIKWDDAARTLTIGPREGAFPGMLERRTFNVVIVGPGKGAGIEPGSAARVVEYDGSEAKAVIVD